jgi:hypothetical protein
MYLQYNGRTRNGCNYKDDESITLFNEELSTRQSTQQHPEWWLFDELLFPLNMHRVSDLAINYIYT